MNWSWRKSIGVVVIVTAAIGGFMLPLASPSVGVHVEDWTSVFITEHPVQERNYRLETSTTHRRDSGNETDEGLGSSVAFLDYYPPAGWSPAYISEIRAHIRSWSSDPKNSPPGWLLKEEENRAESDAFAVTTAWTHVGGYYFETGEWNCNFPGESWGQYLCYNGTRSYFNDSNHGYPVLIDFIYSSSSDNSFANFHCWWDPKNIPPSVTDDLDCDGFGNVAELWIGTNGSEACGYTAGAPVQSENWPADLSESNTINIVDVLALSPVFGSSVPPTSPRFDLVPDGTINILDVLALNPVFGESCTPQ